MKGHTLDISLQKEHPSKSSQLPPFFPLVSENYLIYLPSVRLVFHSADRLIASD
jgi:hypothetical protein